MPQKSKKEKPMLQVVNVGYVGQANLIKKGEGKPQKTTQKERKNLDMSYVVSCYNKNMNVFY